MVRAEKLKAKPKPRPKFTDKAQSGRFIEAARERDAESTKDFDTAFNVVVKPIRPTPS